MATAWADLTPQGGLPVWRMGENQYWGSLGNWLKRFGVEDLVVDNEVAEGRMVQLQRCIDESWDDEEDGMGLVHSIVGGPGGDNGEMLLKRVLALGADPDLADSNGWRPSHEVIQNSRVRCCEAIFFCRPRWEAEGTYDDGQLESVLDAYKDLETRLDELDEDSREIYDILSEQKSEGPPTVAELACKQHFWAVKNLFRRRVVSDGEVWRRHEGMNVFQWVQHHGQTHLLRELNYLMSTPASRSLKQSTDNLEKRLNGLQSLVDHLAAKVVSLEMEVQRANSRAAGGASRSTR